MENFIKEGVKKYAFQKNKVIKRQILKQNVDDLKYAVYQELCAATEIVKTEKRTPEQTTSSWKNFAIIFSTSDWYLQYVLSELH